MFHLLFVVLYSQADENMFPMSIRFTPVINAWSMVTMIIGTKSSITITGEGRLWISTYEKAKQSKANVFMEHFKSVGSSDFLS